MRLTFALICLAAASGLLAQLPTNLNTTAGQFWIHGNSYTSTTNAAMLGGTDFLPVGATDYSFRQAWVYRQQGDGREYNVSNPSATFANTLDTWDAQLFKGPGNSNTAPPTLRFDARYELTSPTATTPLLHATLCVTNLTSAPIQASVFYYIDLDIPNGFLPSFNDDSLTVFGNPFHARLSDWVDPSYFAETLAIGATGYQYGLPFEGMFSNNGVDNLNNSVNALFGDLVIAYQWDCFIPPSDCCLSEVYIGLNMPVPEPNAIAALAFGAAMLVRKRRR